MSVFEFEMHGKTYQTGKLTPELFGKAARVFALIQKEMAPFGDEEQQSDWAKTLVGALIIEKMPDIFWDALSIETKNKIGTRQDFYDGLLQETKLINSFTEWCGQSQKEASDFLPKKPADQVNQPPLQESTPPSAANMAGQLNTANSLVL